MVQQSPSCSLTHTHTPPHSFSPLSRSIDISHLLADIAKRTFPTLVWMSGRLRPWIFCPLISYTRTHTHTHVSLCLSISCPLCFFSLSGLFYLPNLLLFFLFPHQLCTPQSLRSACEIRSAAASRLCARQEHLVFSGKSTPSYYYFYKHSHMRAYLNPNHFHVRSLLVSILTFPRPIGPSRTSWLPTVLLSSCIFLVSSLSDSLKRWSLLSCFSKKGQKSQNGG